MLRVKSFIKTTLLGGLVVILPVTIIVAVFSWLYLKVTDLIQPLTNLITKTVGLKEFIADFVVIAIIIGFCFAVGLLIRTQWGRFVHEKLESRVLKIAPGYNLVKETVLQFLGHKRTPFSRVALVQLFENQTLATAFITDEHDDGRYTVFVPTGPNPTSGQIFHLRRQFVHPIDAGIDDTIRSIISCGAGSKQLLAHFTHRDN
jgi:uncharacterized membrane protein